MAQFSCCWSNSACGGWLVEKTPGRLQVHESCIEADFWEKCSAYVYAYNQLDRHSLSLSLFPLCFFPVSEEVVLLLMLSCRINQTAWSPAMSEVTQRKTPFACVSQLSSCHITPATQTWGPGLKSKTRRRLLDKWFAFRWISSWCEHKLQLIPYTQDFCQNY